MVPVTLQLSLLVEVLDHLLLLLLLMQGNEML